MRENIGLGGGWAPPSLRPCSVKGNGTRIWKRRKSLHFRYNGSTL